MPRTCWAPGCRSGYPSAGENGKFRHYFQAPKDIDRLQLWRRRIPRVGELSSKNVICDLHFEERYILKTYTHVINGQNVQTERGNWKLTEDAVPTIFENVPKYLSTKVPKPRRRLCKSGLVPKSGLITNRGLVTTSLNDTAVRMVSDMETADVVAMPKCWTPGCRSGYMSNEDTSKRHFFRAPHNVKQLESWRQHIPRGDDISPCHSLCDLHFEERYIVKKFSTVVDGVVEELDRERWQLTDDAVPTIFFNCPKYLPSKTSKPRIRKMCSKNITMPLRDLSTDALVPDRIQSTEMNCDPTVAEADSGAEEEENSSTLGYWAMEKKRNGSDYCSALNCTNSRNTRNDLTLFTFPSDEKRMYQWFSQSRRNDLNWEKDKAKIWRLTMCEEHFTADQFMCLADKGDGSKRKKHLRHDAVPEGVCDDIHTTPEVQDFDEDCKTFPTHIGNFLQELSDGLFELLEERQLCDTELVTDSESLWAHSVVLASASRPLRNVFLSSYSPHYRIQLYGCDRVAIETVLRFIYTGHLVASTSSHAELPELNRIYAVCKLLGVPVERLEGALLSLEHSPIASESVAPSECLLNESSSLVEENMNDKDVVFSSSPGHVLKHSLIPVSTADEEIPEKLARGHVLEHSLIPVSTADEEIPDKSADRLGKSMPDLDPIHSESVLTRGTPSRRTGQQVGRLRPAVGSNKRNSHFRPHKKQCVSNVFSKYNCNEGFSAKSRRKPGANSNDKPKFVCSTCGQLCPTSSRLRRHQFVKHSAERPHVCDACGKVYRFRSSLSQHIQFAHSRGSRDDSEGQVQTSWICDPCGKSFSRPIGLRRHVARVHLDHRPYVCQTCGKRCCKAFQLRDHIASKHGTTKPHTCPTCGVGFGFRSNLVRHLRLHSSVDLHTCDQCGDNFRHRQNLTAHQRTFHGDRGGKKRILSGNQEFCCVVCGEKFGTIIQLAQHKVLHPELQQSVYSCPVCDKTFTKACYLANHTAVHRDKPIQCAFCPKKFTIQSRCTRHCSSKHASLVSKQTEELGKNSSAIPDESTETLQSGSI